MNFNSKVMTLNEKKGVMYLTYNRLSELPYIKHAFTTKHGGVSKGQFATMNMCFEHDKFDDVTENYKIFCDAVGFNFKDLVASSQDHHTYIRVCTDSERGIGIYRDKDIDSVDGLITNSKNVTLVTYYADCTPLFFIDPINKAIGLAHAGWRGTVAKIGKVLIDKMSENYNTNPNDLICAIGPAISKCCYEVDKECAEHFINLGLNTEKFVFPMKNGKYMIDLLETNRQILLSCGVENQNITISDICTKCNSDLLWSHRATNGKRGTMSAFMKLL